MPFKSEKQRKWMWANDPKMAKKWEKEEKMKKETKVKNLIKKMVREIMSETAKRDYKAEYKKYGSSTKAKKYRAELNKYNRDKGTYGNGDGKDASHKGGKIVGFEEQSKNRGRAEKSRLKKEEKLTEKTNIFDKVKLPPLVDRFLNKFVDSMKDSKLNRIKRSAILYKVINASGMSVQQLMADIQKIKKQLSDEPVKEGKLTEAKETIFDVAARVIKDKQHQNYKSKKGMVKVDMQSANLLTKVWAKVNPKMKKILSDLGYNNPAGLMKTLWAVVK